jgi:hypothetical protein
LDEDCHFNYCSFFQLFEEFHRKSSKQIEVMSYTFVSLGFMCDEDTETAVDNIPPKYDMLDF